MLASYEFHIASRNNCIWDQFAKQANNGKKFEMTINSDLDFDLVTLSSHGYVDFFHTYHMNMVISEVIKAKVQNSAA